MELLNQNFLTLTFNEMFAFQLICMSPSYDNFLTGNDGDLPLTDVINRRARQSLDCF